MSVKQSEFFTSDEDLPTTKSSGRRRILTGRIDLAVTDMEAGDIVMIAEVPGNATILDFGLTNDTLDSGNTVAYDLGLYDDVNGQLPVAPQAYAANSFTFRALPASPREYDQMAFRTRTVGQLGQFVWQDAGLTKATNRTFFIGLVFVAAGNQAGTICHRIEYVAD